MQTTIIHLPTNLQFVRKKMLGLTQEELANKLGITRSVIASIESGVNKASLDFLVSFMDFGKSTGIELTLDKLVYANLSQEKEEKTAGIDIDKDWLKQQTTISELFEKQNELLAEIDTLRKENLALQEHKQFTESILSQNFRRLFKRKEVVDRIRKILEKQEFAVIERLLIEDHTLNDTANYLTLSTEEVIRLTRTAQKKILADLE